MSTRNASQPALREPDLPHPREGERIYVEIKLLVDHRDDLIDDARQPSDARGVDSWK